MTEYEQDLLREEIQALRAQNPRWLAAASRACGWSVGTLGMWLRKKYKGNNELIAVTLRAFVDFDTQPSPTDERRTIDAGPPVKFTSAPQATGAAPDLDAAVSHELASYLESAPRGAAAEISRVSGVSRAVVSRVARRIYPVNGGQIVDRIHRALVAVKAANDAVSGRLRVWWLISDHDGVRLTGTQPARGDPDVRVVRVLRGTFAHDLYFLEE